ncbi:hypothetical protein [Synechococcus sp. MIT S1220]|uniref:hypothetical protein n=1 Tax=Synechococcus sp. MIT S1220 TaxID=3082549 RepID=UPI0039B0758A
MLIVPGADVQDVEICFMPAHLIGWRLFGSAPRWRLASPVDSIGFLDLIDRLGPWPTQQPYRPGRP